MHKMSAWVGIQERGGPEVLPGLPQSVLEQAEGKGKKGMIKSERFLWKGWTYAQMQAWKREREELRNGEEWKFL